MPRTSLRFQGWLLGLTISRPLPEPVPRWKWPGASSYKNNYKRTALELAALVGFSLCHQIHGKITAIYWQRPTSVLSRSFKGEEEVVGENSTERNHLGIQYLLTFKWKNERCDVIRTNWNLREKKFVSERQRGHSSLFILVSLYFLEPCRGLERQVRETSCVRSFPPVHRLETRLAGSF